MAYKKECKNCGEIFQPTGKYTTVCEDCRLELYPHKRPNKSDHMKENKKFPYKKTRK